MLEYKHTVAIIQIVISFLFYVYGGIIGAIFAILGLIEGNKVKTFKQEGNFEAVKASLKKANRCSKFSWNMIAICMILVILYLLFVFSKK